MSRRKLLLIGAILSTCVLVSIQASQSGGVDLVGPEDEVGGNEIDAQGHSIGDSNGPLLCGVGHPSTFNRTRIYGGVEADPGEYPWMVNIQSRYGGHFCGGVIIDERHILTAKHCIGPNVKYFMRQTNLDDSEKFYIGDHDQTTDRDGDQTVGIEEVMFQGPLEDRTHDIALLRTSEAMKFRLTEGRYGSVNKICLAEFIDFKFLSGTNVTIAGWGSTENLDYPAKLREVDVSIKICVGSEHEESPHELCATADKGRDACVGDSGGPLFVQSASGQFVLVGIVQGGPGGSGDDNGRCGDGSRDGNYANVHYYMDWIKQNRKKDKY